MLSRFYPFEYCSSVYDIDFRSLYKAGYRGIIFDIDNTLVRHNAPVNDTVRELIQSLKNIGFDICLLSNNNAKRVNAFGEDLDVFHIHRGGKPNTKGYIRAMALMNTCKGNTVFVGDQIFTDIWGANRAGIHSMLVQPIDKNEGIQIKIERLPEKLILRSFLTRRKREA